MFITAKNTAKLYSAVYTLAHDLDYFIIVNSYQAEDAAPIHVAIVNNHRSTYNVSFEFDPRNSKQKNATMPPRTIVVPIIFSKHASHATTPTLISMNSKPNKLASINPSKNPFHLLNSALLTSSRCSAAMARGTR